MFDKVSLGSVFGNCISHLMENEEMILLILEENGVGVKITLDGEDLPKRSEKIFPIRSSMFRLICENITDYVHNVNNGLLSPAVYANGDPNWVIPENIFRSEYGSKTEYWDIHDSPLLEMVADEKGIKSFSWTFWFNFSNASNKKNVFSIEIDFKGKYATVSKLGTAIFFVVPLLNKKLALDKEVPKSMPFQSFMGGADFFSSLISNVMDIQNAGNPLFTMPGKGYHTMFNSDDGHCGFCEGSPNESGTGEDNHENSEEDGDDSNDD